MMSEKKWFVLIDEKVQGPYRVADVLKEVERGNWTGSRFWAKGKPHWMILSQFQSEVEKERSGKNQPHHEEPQWYMLADGVEQGPLTYTKLLDSLKNKPNYKNIQVSSEPTKEWREVYQVDALMEKLGVNRRTHPRVPIDGILVVQDGFLKGKQATLTTLSQGGVGAKDIKGFSIGEKFKGSFSSPSIPVPIYFQAEVVFMSPQGTLGLKFLNVSTESLAQIIAYVKQFVQSHPEVDFRKIA